MPSNGHAGGKLVIGYPHGGGVRQCFMASLMGFREYDLSHGQRLAAVLDERGLYLPSVRNKLVWRFLAMPDQCEWLMMIDTDMKFEPHIPHQLIDAANELGVQVMTALYFGILVKPVPMWWTRNKDGDMCTVSDIDLDKFSELAGFGTGMFVAHRSVYKAMAERYKEDAWPFFAHDQVTFNGHPEKMGEDLCFCQRLTDMGIPMFGDGRIRVGHEKAQLLTLESFLETHVQRKPGEQPVNLVLED